MDAELKLGGAGRRAIYWVVALSLAGALLYSSLRGVDWRRVFDLLAEARLSYVLVAFGVMSAALALRSLRWRVLLSAGAEMHPVTAFWATSVGYLGNNFLPARAGELLRTVIVSRSVGLSKTFVLTTVLCERLVDAVSLLVIGAVVLLQQAKLPAWLDATARPLALGGVLGVAALVLVPLFEPFWGRVIQRLPLPDRMRELAEHTLEQGLKGMRSLHSLQRLTLYILLTSGVWALDGLVMMVAARSIGLWMAWPLAMLLVVGLGLGSALPSTPGYVGIYQFVAVTLLTPFGFQRSDAIAFILLFQALTYAVFLLWGVLGLTRTSPELLRRKAPAV